MSDQEPSKPVADNDDEQPRTNDDGKLAEEFGGPKGKEPTRYGDWEKNGRCIDF